MMKYLNRFRTKTEIDFDELLMCHVNGNKKDFVTEYRMLTLDDAAEFFNYVLTHSPESLDPILTTLRNYR